jgi:agmatine deiminase
MNCILCGGGSMAETLTTTPRDDGFRMPAEWEAHQGCWLLWPERPDNWRLGAKPAQAAFAAVASAIAEHEPVTVGVSRAQFENARARLPARIRVIELSSDDCWMRDVGPTFVTDAGGRLRAVDWIFNAWGGLDGGLYFPWDQDDLVAGKVAEIERAPRYRAPFVLEGGAVHTDGEGTLLVTEECLLNPNRNPGLDRAGIEELLRAYLGVETIIWLGQGVYRDETDGHVDNLACFARPGVVALTWEDDPSDPQHAISMDALARLERARDAKGRPIEVVRLPQPGPLHVTAEESMGLDRAASTKARPAGDRLAASYVNHYLGNGVVVVPLLDPARDGEALDILARLHPARRVVGVPGREILLGGGNVHCITQQQPVGTLD